MAKTIKKMPARLQIPACAGMTKNVGEAKVPTAKALERAAKKEAKETDVQAIVNAYFISKGLSLEQIKEDAKQRKIIYSRHIRPAKQLLELAGSKEKALSALKQVAVWAISNKLDFSIETVLKKWLELSKLKPKEQVKKPFYEGNPMHYDERRQKYSVLVDGEWKEYCDKEEKIEWRVVDKK